MNLLVFGSIFMVDWHETYEKPQKAYGHADFLSFAQRNHRLIRTI
jgi:hypothetical protein